MITPFVTASAAIAPLVLPAARGLQEDPEPAEVVVLRGGTLHTMEAAAEPAPGSLVIRDGRIEAVLEPGADLPEGARVVDVSGKHVLPGLVDGMVSFDPDHDALYLSSGITTVRDTGNNLALVLTERKTDARDRGPGPRLVTAGAALDGVPPSSPEAVAIPPEADAEHYLAPLLQAGVDFLSVQPGLSETAWRKVAAEAVEHGASLWGYRLPGVPLTDAIAAGQSGFYFLDALLPEGVEWAFVLPPAVKPGIEALAEGGAALVPNAAGVPVILEGVADLASEDEEAKPPTYDLALLSPFYEGWWTRELAARRGIYADEETGPGHFRTGRRVVDKQHGILVQLAEAGVDLLPGSGAPHPGTMPGAGLHRELAEWEAAGLSRERILAAATRDAARVMGIAEETGTLAAGKAADVLVVSGDPREELATLARPELVYVRGFELTADDLRARRGRLRARNEELRAELERPLEIAEPEKIEGELLAAGQVETVARGVRISGERYRVVREGPGRVAYSARVLNPGNASYGSAEVELVQRTVEGELSSFRFAVDRGGRKIEIKGEFLADSLQVERRVDGEFLDTQTSVERVEAIGVGSVTSLMVLARLGRGGRLPSLYFHELFEPEVVAWDLNFSQDGDFLLSTPRGVNVLFVTDDGEFTRWLNDTGSGVLTTDPVDTGIEPGAGHPLPAGVVELRQRIRTEAAERAAQAEEAGNQGDAAPVEAGAPLQLGGRDGGAGDEGSDAEERDG